MINGIDVSEMETDTIVKANFYYELYLRRGIGINNTPYTEFQVRSVGDAERFGIEITLMHTPNRYVGKPVENGVEDISLNIPSKILHIDTDPKKDDVVNFGVAVMVAREFIMELRDYFSLGGTNDNT